MRDEQLTQLRAAHTQRVNSIEKATYMFSRILSGIWEFPAVLSDPSSGVHLSFLNIPASHPAAMLSFCSHLSPLLQHGQALENMIQVPTKSLNALKWPRARWATTLQVQPMAHHSFPPLCWAATSPAAPRTGYSSFHFGIIQHTGCFLLVFGFKWLGGNAERRNWSKGTSHPPPAVHVLLVTIQHLTEEGLANSVFAKLPPRQDFNLQQ